jgi:hypothetical protein
VSAIGFALRFVLYFALRFVLHFVPRPEGRRSRPLADWHRAERDSLTSIAPQGVRT